MPVQRMSNLVQALLLLELKVAIEVESIGFEEEPDLVSRVQEVSVIGLKLYHFLQVC